MEKDFSDWHRLKERIHHHHDVPTYQQRQIWWCSVGVNVGYEVDGKNRYYNRPVLVIRKFNKDFFFGIPLSTKQKKENKYYFPLHFKGKDICALISQARPFDAKRLTHMEGMLPNPQFNAVRKAFADMIGFRGK